jgi:hypothetical protein
VEGGGGRREVSSGGGDGDMKTVDSRFAGRHVGRRFAIVGNCRGREGEGRGADADLEIPDGTHLPRRDGTLLADDLAVFLAHGPLLAHGLVVSGHLEGGFLAPGAHGRHLWRVETAVERAGRRAMGRVARVTVSIVVLARLGTWRALETASRRGL